MWNSPADDDEAQELDRLIAETPRLARRELVGELVTVGILAAAVGVAVMFRLGVATLLMGSLLLLLLAFSAWKRHHLGSRAMLVGGGGRAAYLEALLAAKEAELKRSALGLALIVPGTFISALLMFALRDNGGGGDVLSFLAGLLVTPRGIVATLLLIAAVSVYAGAHVRLRSEIERLRGLRHQYEEEARRDGFGAS